MLTQGDCDAFSKLRCSKNKYTLCRVQKTSVIYLLLNDMKLLYKCQILFQENNYFNIAIKTTSNKEKYKSDIIR